MSNTPEREPLPRPPRRSLKGRGTVLAITAGLLTGTAVASHYNEQPAPLTGERHPSDPVPVKIGSVEPDRSKMPERPEVSRVVHIDTVASALNNTQDNWAFMSDAAERLAQDRKMLLGNVTIVQQLEPGKGTDGNTRLFNIPLLDGDPKWNQMTESELNGAKFATLEPVLGEDGKPVPRVRPILEVNEFDSNTMSILIKGGGKNGPMTLRSSLERVDNSPEGFQASVSIDEMGETLENGHTPVAYSNIALPD